MFQVVEKFIFQLEYSVSYERNKVYETKCFALKDEKNLLVENVELMKNMAIILNSVLLRPFEINLQLKAFHVIRRLYYLYPQYSEAIISPLNLVLSNISIYSVRGIIYYLVTKPSLVPAFRAEGSHNFPVPDHSQRD